MLRFFREIGAFIGLVAFAASSWAVPKLDPAQQVYMQADKIGYDQKNAIVVAQGAVQVLQGGTSLVADQIAYYQNQDIVRAKGHVTVTDQTGEIYYADEVQLQQSLKQGVVVNFRARLIDNSQFAAREARKVSAQKTQLTQAVYSACKICEGKSPFWQFKADKVEIDQEDERVYYEDLQLELLGVPVAYTPYFLHPLPDNKRKSGLLQPEYSQDSNLGSVVQVPYYWNIAPDKDATIKPIYTSDEGMVLDAEYRQRTNSGYYTFAGSITNPDKRDDTGLVLAENELRGHIFATGENQFNNHWRGGFDIRRATDDTYLRKYDYSNARTLDSQIFLEGDYGRSYAKIQSLAFQGLQEEDNPDEEPFLLPLAEGYIESSPLWNGSRWYGLANTQIITRNEELQSRRLSFTGGYKIPVVTSGGHLIDIDGSTRTDIYSVENEPLTSGQQFDGEKTRIVPQLAMKWRYPLMRQVGSGSLTIEPTVLAVVAGRGNNPDEIPNEDNRIVEFSDANLFDANRFPGYDTVDEGSRIAYGARAQWMIDSMRNLQFLLGQNYSTEDSTPFPYANPLGKGFSDYVGRVAFDYDPVTLSYLFRFDEEDLHANSNTLSVEYFTDPFEAQLSYITLDEDSLLDENEEIYAAMAMSLTDEWRVFTNSRRDLIKDNTLFFGTGLEFHNDCFTLTTAFSRQFVRDRDYEPDTNVSVRVSFKNLDDL